MTRFQFDWEKAVQAIDYLARLKPEITQYYIGKILFFAEREHLLDYGRPITGDRFVAMEHGPVPSSILNLLKADSDYPDAIIDALYQLVEINQKGNLRHVTSKETGNFSRLSGSDQEYLKASLEKHGNMSFPELKSLSHQDKAYDEAWNRDGSINNELNCELWLDDFENPELAKLQLHESGKYAA